MGQRHQIYLRLPAIDYGKNNGNNRPEITVGMHNQWLFGANAISSLYRFLKFAKANAGNQYNPLSKPSIRDGLEILDHIYSVDVETGYSTGNHKFETDKKSQDYCGEVEDPRKGDNNNGITVIDMQDPDKPTYCFMSIGHLECLHESKQDKEESDQPAYVNFTAISATEWIALHYGDHWASNKDLAMTKERIDFITQNFEVTSTKRLIQIFPKLKTALLQGAEDKEKLNPNSVRFIDSLKKEKKRK